MKIKNANLSCVSDQLLLYKDSNPAKCLQNNYEAETKAALLFNFFTRDPNNILDMS